MDQNIVGTAQQYISCEFQLGPTGRSENLVAFTHACPVGPMIRSSDLDPKMAVPRLTILLDPPYWLHGLIDAQ